MPDVYVAISAFNRKLVLDKGHKFIIELVSQSCANGIEFRKEFLPDKNMSASLLNEETAKHRLGSTYSAPVPLWDENGRLNGIELKKILREAVQLGAKIVKVTLGRYQKDTSSLDELKTLIDEQLIDYPLCQITVENDQLEHSGDMNVLKHFFKDCESQGVPVGMTFDIGNWHWLRQDPLAAADNLSMYVRYIHCKQVEGQPPTSVPLSEDKRWEWQQIMRKLPFDVPRCIEFQLPGDPELLTIQRYVRLLSEA